MNPAAKVLGVIGLVLLAGGGVYYSVAPLTGDYGLMASGLGLVLVIIAGAVAHQELAAMLKSRSARLGLGAGLSILVVLALVIFLGALASRHNLRWDLTETGAHTLAPQTKKVLEGLTSPVKVYAFFREQQEGRRQAADLLQRFKYLSPQFSYRFVDPDQEPGLAKKFEVTTYGESILTAGKREERIKLMGEEALTNALIRLGREGQKKVYFVTGHGERSLQDIGDKGFSQIDKALGRQNYASQELTLATVAQVPPDAAVVVIAAPKTDFMSAELTRLDAYLDRGGAILLLLEPQEDAGLKGWLAKRGVLIKDDLILDKASTLFGASPAWPLAGEYGDHAITEPLTGINCIFPMARSVSLEPKLPAGIKGIELIKTSPVSWGETNLSALDQEARFDEGQDLMGPVSLAVSITQEGKAAPKTEAASKPEAATKSEAEAKAAEKPAPPEPQGPLPEGKMVVIGDADFAANAALGQGGNQDLAMNSISYLAEEGDLIAIAAKDQKLKPLLLTPGQAQLVFWLPTVIWPLIFLTIGVMVYLRRRRAA